jgi:hypothetical protein
MFGGGQKDELEARGALGSRLQSLVDDGRIRLITGFRSVRVKPHGTALAIDSDDGTTIGPVDEIVVATGFRPDLSLGRELRLELDPWLEAPEQLAPLIDPNVHSCGTVYPHGAAELSHPEKDYYVVGMKSYGRAPTFLLLTGYEQVRSVACALLGDTQGAMNVELVLPETGVCQSDLVGASCCSTAPVSATPLSRATPRGATPTTPVAATRAAASCGSGLSREPEPVTAASECGCGCGGNCDDHCDDSCRADAKARATPTAAACCE